MYAVLETVLQQQARLIIFVTTSCLLLGVNVKHEVYMTFPMRMEHPGNRAHNVHSHNPCSDPEKYVYTLAKFPEFSPVDAC